METGKIVSGIAGTFKKNLELKFCYMMFPSNWFGSV